MKRAISWFAENRIAANLLMLLLIAGGLLVLPGLPQKSFPDIDIDLITIGVEYRGAAPEEVELGVCIRIEEAIDGVIGIEEIRSTATEGACAIVVELLSGTDVSRALDDIKNRVDGVDTLPEDTELPVVSQVAIKRAVIDLAVTGSVGERTLKQIAQRVRDEIAALSGITQVELLSVRPYEISIEVPEASLRRHGLTFDQVANAVRRSSLDLPGGSIKTEGGEILLRTQGQAYSGRDFEQLVVLTRDDGTRLRLEEIAHVVDGFEDTDQWAEFNGRQAAMVRVFRVGDQDILEIAESVKNYVSLIRHDLPPGVEVTLWQDDSQLLRGRLDTLIGSGRMGYAFVLVVLAIFLRLRLAFWISLGVPISLLGAILTFPFLGISIDGISVFAFIVVLGILVDDAIVVGESVHSEQKRSGQLLEAAIRGTHRVSTPVVFGVLTTVSAFAPMLLVSGRMGQIFSEISTVVIACLLFSLLESQWILPAHLGHRSRLSERLSQYFKPGVADSPARLALERVSRVRERVATGLERFAEGPYRLALARALEWRYTTVAIGVALLLCAVAVVASGRLAFSFFPALQADYVTARLSMPQGIPIEDTAEAVQQIEHAVADLKRELDPDYAPHDSSLVRHVLTSVGGQPSTEAAANNPQGAGNFVSRGSHLGEVTLELVSSEQRQIPTNEVAQRWRELTGPVPAAVELAFSSSLFSVGNEIDLQLQGARVSELREAASRVKAMLAGYPGVIDIADSFRSGKQEIKLQILPSAQALGLTLQDLARQVRQAFYGEEAQRIQRERDDVRVMVRYPRTERRSLGDLEFMRIRTPDGSEVPFGAVARADFGRGFSTIRRTNRQRVVNVTADVDRTQVTANEVVAAIEAGPLQQILGDYPEITYSLVGAQREQRRSLGSLIRWYPVALFCIYALLAIPLVSYVQPLIIMAVIPFSLLGAVLGHLLFGKGLSFMSVMGLVAASGVVVNSSLLLVHHMNQRRREGESLHSAIQAAAASRLRPIVLTAMTTFVGLLPLMLSRSVQAQFLVPMAISLAFGVAVAAFVTLLIVPSGYLILEDLRNQRRRS